jgi:phytoene desaturase
MISITNALYKLAIKKGVSFVFNTKVQRIIQHEGSVRGIVAANKNYNADIVISNMDAYFTYKHLLNQQPKADKILKQERSSSALIFYWGIRQEFKQLGLHNILFSDDYKKEFEALFQKHNLYKDPTVYINITSKCEAGIMAPTGKENWFVMINAPANHGQNWEQLKQEARAKIIEKINRLLKTDIEALIETEEILDPIQIETKTDSYMGSLYGTSSNSKLAAFLRHPNFSKTTSGLYFVGGSVHPGGGIPLCLRSAKIATDMIK